MTKKSDRIINPLQECFKQSLDHFGVKGTDLIKIVGLTKSNLSDIRNSAVYPQTDKFWRLVEAADEIKPGVKRYLGNLIAKNATDDSLQSIINNLDLDEFVAHLTPEQKSQILFAIANDINKKPAKNTKKPIIQQETEEKLAISC